MVAPSTSHGTLHAYHKDPVARTHAAHGFEPTGKRGELSPWHWDRMTLSYAIRDTDGLDMAFDQFRELVDGCFAKVRDACGLHFVDATDLEERKSDQAVDIPIHVKKEQDWPAFHTNSRILGLGWFPNAANPSEGQIILNGSYRFGDGGALPAGADLEDDEYRTPKTVVLEYVLLHEIGHALGLPHASPECDRACIMAPVYNAGRGWHGTYTGEDLERLQALYGKPPSARPRAPKV